MISSTVQIDTLSWSFSSIDNKQQESQQQTSLNGSCSLDHRESSPFQINRRAQANQKRFVWIKKWRQNHQRFIWVDKSPNQPVQDHLSSRQIVTVSHEGDFNHILKKTLSRYRIPLHVFPNPTCKWIRDHYIILTGRISALAHGILNETALDERALQRYIAMRRYIDEVGGTFGDYCFIHSLILKDGDGEGYMRNEHQQRFKLLSQWRPDVRKLLSVIEGGNLICTRNMHDQPITIIGENSIFLTASFLKNYTPHDTESLHEQRTQLSKSTSLSSHTPPISDSRKRMATAVLLRDLNIAPGNAAFLPQLFFHIDLEMFQAKLRAKHIVFLNSFGAVRQSIEALTKRPSPSSQQFLQDVLEESQRLDRLMQRRTQQQIDALQQKRIRVVKMPGIFYYQGQLLASYMNALTGQDDKGRSFYIGLKYHAIFDKVVKHFLRQQGFHFIHLIGKSDFNQSLLAECGGGLRCQTLVAPQSIPILEHTIRDRID